MDFMLSRKAQFVKALVITLLSVAVVGFATAQTPHLTTADGPDRAPAQFDVVSIHPSDPSIQTENLNYDPGWLRAQGITLSFLLQSAYNMKDFQIQGLPSQLKDKKYDIAARMLDPSSEATWQLSNPQVRSARERLYQKRIQNILETRFGLKYHMATKKGKILVLRKSSQQFKVAATEGREDYLRMHNVEGGMQIDGKNQTMDALASELSYVFHSLVKNETGLPGRYDFLFSWRTDDAVATDTNLPDISTAIRDALGVKVDTVTGDVQYYVVDQIEAPSPN